MIDLAAAYAEHQDAIYMFLYRRLGDRQVAEDLTSQTFEKALRFADAYEDRGGAVQAWLVTIARRCLLDYYRAPAQRKEAAGDFADLEKVAHTVGVEAPDDWVIERVDLEQAAQQIQVALHVLHPRDRALFLAHYWEGLSFRQVAERYGMAHGAVRSVFWRSHRKLRAALEPVMPDLVTPDLAVATA